MFQLFFGLLTTSLAILAALLIAQSILAFTASILAALWMASAFETRIMDARAMDINQLPQSPLSGSGQEQSAVIFNAVAMQT